MSRVVYQEETCLNVFKRMTKHKFDTDLQRENTKITLQLRWAKIADMYVDDLNAPALLITNHLVFEDNFHAQNILKSVSIIL